MKRLHILDHISDLEHMIAPTRLKMNRIFERLTNENPNSERYPQMIQSLKDNVDYMFRILQFSNVVIDKNEEFNLKEGNLSEFIQSYIKGWENYKGGYFKLNLIDNEHHIPMQFDKTLLTVMLDSILTNAMYHGFHKQKNYTPNNTVEISLSDVEYKEKAYVCLAVANNGDPFSDGFTINDYVARGSFSLDTGRTGLGGNHIYQIVKGHGGFLCLDSNKQWNTIVEILLPIHNYSIENLQKYEHECI